LTVLSYGNDRAAAVGRSSAEPVAPSASSAAQLVGTRVAAIPVARPEPSTRVTHVYSDWIAFLVSEARPLDLYLNSGRKFTSIVACRRANAADTGSAGESNDARLR